MARRLLLAALLTFGSVGGAGAQSCGSLCSSTYGCAVGRTSCPSTCSSSSTRTYNGEKRCTCSGCTSSSSSRRRSSYDSYSTYSADGTYSGGSSGPDEAAQWVAVIVAIVVVCWPCIILGCAQHFCVQPQRQRGRRPTDDAKGAVGCLFVGAFVSLFFGPWAVLWFVSAAVRSCVYSITLLVLSLFCLTRRSCCAGTAVLHDHPLHE